MAEDSLSRYLGLPELRLCIRSTDPVLHERSNCQHLRSTGSGELRLSALATTRVAARFYLLPKTLARREVSFFEGSGNSLFYKRLERGNFRLPEACALDPRRRTRRESSRCAARRGGPRRSAEVSAAPSAGTLITISCEYVSTRRPTPRPAAFSPDEPGSRPPGKPPAQANTGKGREI